MQETLDVEIFSFGFKYGYPLEVNLLLDVRFLPNPYWVDDLRPKTGLQERVSEYVLESEAGKSLCHFFEPHIKNIIASSGVAGKKSVKIAIGCTGGRHRSVAVTEWLVTTLAEMPIRLTVFHRDIDKDGQLPV